MLKKYFIHGALLFWIMFVSGAILLPTQGIAGLGLIKNQKLTEQTDEFGIFSGFNIDAKDPVQLVATIIRAFLGLLGVIFLVLLVYAGYLWMTAQGEEEQVTKAKSLITQAVVGLIIVLSAYAVSYFVVDRLERATLQQSTSTSP